MKQQSTIHGGVEKGREDPQDKAIKCWLPAGEVNGASGMLHQTAFILWYIKEGDFCDTGKRMAFFSGLVPFSTVVAGWVFFYSTGSFLTAYV